MAYQPRGRERLVNTATDGAQLAPQIAMLASGGYVVVWRDDPIGSRGQVFDADGNKVGADFATEAWQVAALPGGGFVALWGDSQNVLAQIHDASGAPVGSSFVVNTTMVNQFPESIAALSSGEFVIVWNDQSVLGNSDVRGQLFSADGARLGAEFVVNQEGVGTGFEGGAEVKGLAGGGFVVTWGSEHDIEGQVYSSAGARVGGEFQVNSVAGNMVFPQIAALASGGFAIVWTEDAQLSGPEPFRGIHAQLFGANGARVGTEILVAPDGPEQGVSLDVASLATGGFVITWATRFGTVSDGSGTVVKAQVLDDLGNEVGAELIVNSTTKGDQIEPVVTGLASGDFVISWADGSESGGIFAGVDIRSQLFHSVASIDGTAGNDFLRGTALNDMMFGLAGHDELRGGAGNDTLDGGEGNDIIRGQAGDDILIVSGIGSDMATGGSGSDTLVVDYSGSRTGISTSGPTPNEELGGYNGIYEDSSGRDLWYESIERFVITGGTGNDCLVTADGDDIIDGALGDDEMIGGAGDDLYFVDSARDAVVEHGGEGIDEVRTGLAAYTLAGNVENLTALTDDPHSFRGNVLGNVVTGGGGDDMLNLVDGGDDVANGGGGNDVFLFGAAFNAADVVIGGEGARDQLGIQGNYAGLTLGARSMTGIETFVFLSGADTRFGDPGGHLYSYNVTMNDANVAAGETLNVNYNNLKAGENVVFNGSAESDGSFFLYAGKGVDTVTFGAGADAIFFGAGAFTAADHVDGGAGQDQLGLRGDYTIAFTAATMVNVESLALLSGKDVRFGAASPGFDYDITLVDANVGAGQRLTVNGAQLQAGETIAFDGSAETNGAFRILSGAGNDMLKGGAGADTIYGNLGADTMTGGAGGDTFLYRSTLESNSASRDTIRDFRSGDRIDLSQIDADAGTAGNDAFTFIGTNAFTHHAGELSLANVTGQTWLLMGDTNGDGIADLQILLNVADAHPIVSGDFVL